MVYQFKDASRLRGDPNVVGNRLETIKQAKGGELNPPDVVEDARPKRAVLHGYFEWNNIAAAEQWRLEQARHLIRSVVSVSDSDPDAEPIRHFVDVQLTDEDGKRRRTYITREDAIRHPVLREQLLEQARRDAQAFASKYDQLEELAGVIAAIREAAEVLATDAA